MFGVCIWMLIDWMVVEWICLGGLSLGLMVWVIVVVIGLLGVLIVIGFGFWCG